MGESRVVHRLIARACWRAGDSPGMEVYLEDYRALVGILDDDARRLDGYAVRRVCHELARIVMWKRSARLQLVEDSMLENLFPSVSALVNTNAGVVIDFARFLCRLISLKEPTELDIQSRVTEAGYLRTFSQALRSHPHHPEVFKEICRILTLLCFDMPSAPHADNQLEAVECGLASAILDSFRESPTRSADLAALGCEALLSIVYENAATANQIVNDFGMIDRLGELFIEHATSQEIVVAVARILFQLTTLLPELNERLEEQPFVERMLDFIELNRENCDALHLWHVLKFVEYTLRNSERAKDEFCRCRGPIVFIQAVQNARAGVKGQTQLLVCLYYVACMAFCQLALEGKLQESPTTISAGRIGHLMQSAAHQFALEILKTFGSNHAPVAEQAVRLLALVAGVEANRIPLTRLGASRQVKVIYNSTSHRGLLSLCERAVAAIEVT